MSLTREIYQIADELRWSSGNSGKKPLSRISTPLTDRLNPILPPWTESPQMPTPPELQSVSDIFSFVFIILYFAFPVRETPVSKSLATNLISIALIVVGYLSPVYSEQLLNIGLFAASGALTNWLAIHMLFERIPGIYGSGVVPNRFEQYKKRIRSLVVDRLFTPETLDDFFASIGGNGRISLDPTPIVASIDCERVFDGLVEDILSSPFGGAIRFVGGAVALDRFRDPFQRKMRKEVHNILTSPAFWEGVQSGLNDSRITSEVVTEIDRIVTRRLDEFSPRMVKEIILGMIRRDLGWLVVWGGVFGAFVGLITSLVRFGIH